MKESTRKRISKLGLNEADFEPKDKNDTERLDEVEPVAEMAYVNSEIALALLDMEV